MIKNKSDNRNFDAKTIFQNEDFLAYVFRDLQDYLKKKLRKMNGIFECHTTDENDEDGRWRKTNAFCRMKGIDETFVCFLNDVLGGLTCEAEIVNEITVEGLINDLHAFRRQTGPNRMDLPESTTTQGKEH